MFFPFLCVTFEALKSFRSSTNTAHFVRFQKTNVYWSTDDYARYTRLFVPVNTVYLSIVANTIFLICMTVEVTHVFVTIKRQLKIHKTVRPCSKKYFIGQIFISTKIFKTNLLSIYSTFRGTFSSAIKFSMFKLHTNVNFDKIPFSNHNVQKLLNNQK